MDLLRALNEEFDDNFHFVGNPDDISRISSTLGQNDYSNVLYVGKSGTGKSAIINGIVEAQQPGNTIDVNLPLHMISRKFFVLDISRVFSGSDAEIRSNLQSVLLVLKRPGSNVMVIEDTNDFLDAINDHNVPGVISMFMSELRTRAFQCIWMVREVAGENSNLRDVMDCHSDIEELFTVIRREPAEKEEIYTILDARRKSLESHHNGLSIADDSVKEVVDLTLAYPSLSIYQREQPARAIRMLDIIASTFLTDTTNSKKDDPVWKEAVAKLQNLNAQQSEVLRIKSKAEDVIEEETSIIVDQLLEDGVENPSKMDISALKTKEYRDAEATVAAANKELDSKILPAIEEISKKMHDELTLDISTVRSIFSRLSGIPSNDLNDNESEKVLGFESRMLEKVYGQDHVIKTITGAIKRSMTGLKAPNKPIGGFILLGSSGVGKSYVGEVLAHTMFDDYDNMTVFDMSEFMEKHTVSKLIGAPPGYAGYGSGGALTNSVRAKPHQVILLDEIEKAHPDVFKILLQVMDKGRLSDELGTVDFSNVILLLTTNLAQHLSLDDNISIENNETRDLVITELRTIFPQELINRVDDFLLFKALSSDNIEKIVHRAVKKVNKALSSRTKVSIELDDESVVRLVEDKYKREEGSRQVLKFISNNLERDIADIVLKHPEGGTIKASYNGTDFTLDFAAN